MQEFTAHHWCGGMHSAPSAPEPSNLEAEEESLLVAYSDLPLQPFSSPQTSLVTLADGQIQW